MLDAFSAFKFENFMQQIKKLIRKSEKPLQQLLNRYVEKETLDCHEMKLANNELTVLEKSLHSMGSLAEGCSDPQYRTLSSNSFILKASWQADSCFFTKQHEVVTLENVAYCNVRQCLVVIGREFQQKHDFYEKPCSSSFVGIHVVSHLSSKLKTWPLNSISGKYFKMPFKKNKYIVFPLLHTP